VLLHDLVMADGPSEGLALPGVHHHPVDEVLRCR
jgi:hypothetical protein